MQEYFGFREAIMSDDEMSAFYGGERDENIYGCLQNEYLVLKNMEGQVCDQFKCRLHIVERQQTSNQTQKV